MIPSWVETSESICEQQQMIDSSAAAPALLLQLVLQQKTKLTGIDVVVATKEALKMKKLKQNEAQGSMLVLIVDPREGS